MESTQHNQHGSKTGILKRIYLYVVSLISLIMVIIACVSFINLGLKAFVFTKADNNVYSPYACPVATPPTVDGKTPAAAPCDTAAQKQQERDQLVASRQAEASRDLALLIVGIPVFFYHWKLVRKETD